MTQALLTTLLQPLSIDAFIQDHWLREYFITHGTATRLPNNLLKQPLDTINHLLKAYNGAAFFSRGKQTSTTLNAKQQSPLELYRMGMTLYLSDAHNVIPNLQPLLSNLEKSLGVAEGCARAGLFISPAGDGAPCHYDTEDVFSIQLIGTKTFEVAPMTQIKNPVGGQYSPGQHPFTNLYPQISTQFPNIDTATFSTIKMKPGSVLYMPRGTWHSSTAHENSLAISFIINPPILADLVLEQLQKLMLQCPKWRQPMSNKETDITTLLESLPALTTQISAPLLAASLISKSEQHKHLTNNNRFICRPDRRMRASKTNEGEMLIEKWLASGNLEKLGKLRLEKPIQVLAQWINTQTKPFTLQDVFSGFPALSKEQVTYFFQVLLQAQILEALSFPVLET